MFLDESAVVGADGHDGGVELVDGVDDEVALAASIRPPCGVIGLDPAEELACQGCGRVELVDIVQVARDVVDRGEGPIDGGVASSDGFQLAQECLAAAGRARRLWELSR